MRMGAVSSEVLKCVDEANPAGASKRNFRPKKAVIICKEGGACHVRVLGVG